MDKEKRNISPAISVSAFLKVSILITISESCSLEWIGLVESCWSEVPQLRPRIKRVISQIVKINGGKSLSLVDNMVRRLEGYTKNLEGLVLERYVQKI